MSPSLLQVRVLDDRLDGGDNRGLAFPKHPHERVLGKLARDGLGSGLQLTDG